MTASDFNNYLRHPNHLATLPAETLEALAQQYPYSPNVRLLLLLRAKLTEAGNQDAYLNRCAAATCDRAHLYDLLTELEKEHTSQLELPQDERLELRELDELVAADGDDAGKSTDAEFMRLLDEPPYEAPAPVSTPTPVVAEASSPPPPSVRHRYDLDRWVQTAAAYLAVVPSFTHQVRPVPTTPLPPRLISPRRRDEPLQQRLRRIRQRSLSRPAGRGPGSIGKIARRSVIKTEGLASETLAELLVRQGQYDKAIRMYRRLSLLNPEKSRIFAGLIADLQQKL